MIENPYNILLLEAIKSNNPILCKYVLKTIDNTYCDKELLFLCMSIRHARKN